MLGPLPHLLALLGLLATAEQARSAPAVSVDAPGLRNRSEIRVLLADGPPTVTSAARAVPRIGPAALDQGECASSPAAPTSSAGSADSPGRGAAAQQPDTSRNSPALLVTWPDQSSRRARGPAHSRTHRRCHNGRSPERDVDAEGRAPAQLAGQDPAGGGSTANANPMVAVGGHRARVLARR